MVHARVGHGGEGHERVGGGVEDLGAGVVAAPREDHPAIAEQRRRVRLAGRVHGDGGRPGARRRIVDLGIGIDDVCVESVAVRAAGHEDPAIQEPRRRVRIPRVGHRRDERPGVQGRVVDLGRVRDERSPAIAVLSSGDEHPAVPEQHAPGIVATHVHLRHHGPAVRGRVVDLGAPIEPGPIATRHEDAAVRETHRGVGPTRIVHRRRRCEGPARRVVDLGRVPVGVAHGLAPGDEDPPAPERGGGVVPAVEAHGAGGRKGAGRRIIELCAPQELPEAEPTSRDEHAPVRQWSRRGHDAPISHRCRR